MAFLIDLTKCIGCEACSLACKQENHLPPGSMDKLSAVTWTTIERHGGVNVKRQCNHCVDPTCVSVCPVAALQKTKLEAVIYDETRCIGCRYCIMACPFDVPKYEWFSTQPRVRKCIHCYPRLERGEQPACTEACPTGAAKYGKREDLLLEAKQRIREAPGRYVDHIYGEHEAGGTCALYLTAVPFEQLGFKQIRTDTTYPHLTWNVLRQLPSVVSVGGVGLAGLWWITHRRMELAEERAKEAAESKREEKGQ
ncbi:MAG: 4Fe-4S dicluster domain-containing protein [Fimbriimonadales bacterium]|nr:4Fe-4S dicluster domain-containing protein [Fimbriimonadales bacterium]